MAYSRLDIDAREEIMCVLAGDRHATWTAIGKRVGCHRSSVQREVDRNGGRGSYSARVAQQRADRLAARSTFRFDTDPELATEIRQLLEAGYSPYAAAQITAQVCTETVYQGIYTGRLGVNPTHVLRTRRRKRRHRHLRQPTSDGNYLGAYTPIAERPSHIERRHRIGHWEGDLITGTRNQSAIITLTERLSRLQVALRLHNGHSANATITRITRWLDTHHLNVVSLTWDQGAELTRWATLTKDYGITVYFCDRRSPWQRASNENANRQLRFWFPRRTNLNIYTQADLDHACHILNTTPRRLHHGATAQDIYNHHTRTKE